MGSLHYLHYDVFTDTRLAGNQLAVFLDARGLSTDQMQRITREMSFSESTFILPAERPDTDVRIRIFTPGTEMPMAGHPTVGSAFALAEAGVIARNTRRVVCGLNVGPVSLDLEWRDGNLDFVWMTQANPAFDAPLADRGEVAAAIALTQDDLVADLPVQAISCGVPFLFVPLRDRATVDRALTDAAAFRRLRDATGIDLPMFLFALTGPAAVHSRMFAPEFGIVEDPATGAASGPLGCYLVRHGLVTGEQAGRIVSTQGVAMGRPSTIHIAIRGTRDAITEVKIGGQAILVARGEMIVG